MGRPGAAGERLARPGKAPLAVAQDSNLDNAKPAGLKWLRCTSDSVVARTGGMLLQAPMQGG